MSEEDEAKIPAKCWDKMVNNYTQNNLLSHAYIGGVCDALELDVSEVLNAVSEAALTWEDDNGNG